MRTGDDLSSILQDVQAKTQDLIDGSADDPKHEEQLQKALIAAQKMVRALERPEKVVMRQAFEVSPIIFVFEASR